MPGNDKMDTMALAHLLEFLEKKDFKKKFLKKLNDNIDIPIINEKTEKKVLDKVYDVMVDALESIVDES
tara:strand:- start:469 stop:675 length:207 start_codon:yes stop_codon:yes gene_type:complete